MIELRGPGGDNTYVSAVNNRGLIAGSAQIAVEDENGWRDDRWADEGWLATTADDAADPNGNADEAQATISTEPRWMIQDFDDHAPIVISDEQGVMDDRDDVVLDEPWRVTSSSGAIWNTTTGEAITLDDALWGAPCVLDLNDWGDMVGFFSWEEGWEPFIATFQSQNFTTFDVSGFPININGTTVPATDWYGSNQSVAVAINNHGWLVANYQTRKIHHDWIMQNRAALAMDHLGETPSQWIDLGTLGGNACVATDINDTGQIVGWSTDHAGSRRAFLWCDGRMIDLGTLGGAWSVATGINDRGHVVGYASLADGQERAWLWTDGQMTDLGVVDAGHHVSRAYGINNFGQIVGWSMPDYAYPYEADGTITGWPNPTSNSGWSNPATKATDVRSRCPFLWDHGRLSALPMPPSHAPGHLFRAGDYDEPAPIVINDHALIATTVFNQHNGCTRAVMWR